MINPYRSCNLCNKVAKARVSVDLVVARSLSLVHSAALLRVFVCSLYSFRCCDSCKLFWG